MTIKGLQKLVSQHPESLTIINEMADGEITRQYISVWGQGVYPADGLPTLDEESILALLDVPTDKRKNWTVKSARLDQFTWADVLADNAPSDQLATELPVRLIDETAELKFFETYLGDRPLIAIYPEYLKPIGLTREHTFWTRTIHYNEETGEKSMLLIVKLGYQLAAAISLREHWAKEEKNLKAVRMIHQAAEDIFQRKAPIEP